MQGRRTWSHMLVSHVGQMAHGASAWVGVGPWHHHHLLYELVAGEAGVGRRLLGVWLPGC
jgi:hypothetical protein